MSHEVVHVTSEAHAAVKAFCKRHGLVMRDWVSEVLLELIDKHSPIGPVKDRPIKSLRTQETDAFERPPFYAGRCKE